MKRLILQFKNNKLASMITVVLVDHEQHVMIAQIEKCITKTSRFMVRQTATCK